MFLKTLQLKGFKSFADPTTLQMEPGVTVVVGPNGSGKSNVVDAIAWVLGAQGPRIVRSAKMDDVIFAGSSRRAALGRAEVSLTIDNSARRLPVELNEITITRTLFRTGESEYAINGVASRLLDVQELLSDAGVGRQQHVIISQGQLDSILSARPEERRMVIEEAAGVLKYRRRRERAERRLESSEEALSRLEDLVRELRRQIRPLERQAASALRHEELSAELHAARLFLAGRELSALDERLAEIASQTDAGAARRASLLEQAAALEEAAASQQLAVDERPLEEIDPLVARAAQLAERGRGLAARCEERRRGQADLAGALATGEVLERLGEERQRLAAELAGAVEASRALEPEWESLGVAEAEHQDNEERWRARSASAEVEAGGAAPLLPVAGDSGGSSGTVGAGGAAPLLPVAEARRLAAAARERLGRAREAEARLAERLEAQRRRQHELTTSLAGTSALLATAGEEHAAASAAARTAAAEEATAAEEAELAEQTWRDAAAARQSAAARVEALTLALDEARARAGLERLADQPGVLGTLPDLIAAQEGAALAVEAALAAVLDGVLVRPGEDARRALRTLREHASGGAVLPAGTDLSAPGGAGPGGAGAGPGGAPAGTEPVRPLVRGVDPGVDALLDALLAGVVLCRQGFEAALDAAAAAPGWTVVTLEGDSLGPAGWRVGAGRSGATRAALEEATARAASSEEEAAAAASARTAAAARANDARRAAAVAAREVEGAAARAAQLQRASEEARQRLGSLAGDVQGAESELEAARSAQRAAGVELAAAEEQLARAEEAEREAARRREEAARERRDLEQRARALLVLRRDLEVRAAALEERCSQLRRRHEELGAQIAEQRQQLALAEGRRSATAAEAVVLDRLAQVVAETSRRLEATRSELGAERDARVAALAQARGRLADLTRERDQVRSALESLGERLQRLEVAATEARVRREATSESVRRDLGASAQEAIAAPEPEETGAAEPEREPEPEPDGAEPEPEPAEPAARPAGAERIAALADRAAALERELRSLGPVNPLAREELAELSERQEFLQGQLDDVKGARRELREVIRSVDAEIVEVFSRAYADVAGHFAALITALFPGGEGRLLLTAPDEPLTTGVEIEARPPGRNVRRLSLLSGGERSLVALAFLFAVFRSCPSPFYVMDEVEAALDEVNLRRFLGLLEEFRDEAQLIVVSHQKKTMEVADALYGITMQAGGASRVVSERVRPRAQGRPAGEPVMETT